MCFILCVPELFQLSLKYAHEQPLFITQSRQQQAETGSK